MLGFVPWLFFYKSLAAWGSYFSQKQRLLLESWMVETPKDQRLHCLLLNAKEQWWIAQPVGRFAYGKPRFVRSCRNPASSKPLGMFLKPIVNSCKQWGVGDCLWWTWTVCWPDSWTINIKPPPNCRPQPCFWKIAHSPRKLFPIETRCHFCFYGRPFQEQSWVQALSEETPSPDKLTPDKKLTEGTVSGWVPVDKIRIFRKWM